MRVFCYSRPGTWLLRARSHVQPRRSCAEGRTGHSDALGLVRRCQATHEDRAGFQENVEVQPDRHVLDVIEVVSHLLGLFLEIVRVVIANLRPAGDTWTDRAAERVVRD